LSDHFLADIPPVLMVETFIDIGAINNSPTFAKDFLVFGQGQNRICPGDPGEADLQNN